MHKLLFVSTAVILATTGGANAHHEEQTLPKAKEIQSVLIEYDHPKLDDVAFQATPEDWSAIRPTLMPAKRDPNPAKWESVGTVHLTKKNGQKLDVFLYTTSKAPGAFSAGKSFKSRVYYRGGNSRKLLKALEKAYRNSQAKKDE